MVSDLTIFVGTFNRLHTLERCLDNLNAQDYPKRIVIVDNGSKHPAAIDYLDGLASDYAVYRLPANEDVPPQPGDDLAHGGRTMQAVQHNYSKALSLEWGSGPRPRWYAVCDCDTAPEHPGSIECYVQLAEEFDCAVGPHLNLNVHRNYPLRSLALILNARVLFRERMSWHEGIPYSYDDIDSTFHLFPAAPYFNRLGMRTVRVGPPWWTTHTDWLIDFYEPTEENYAYILGSGDAASWGGGWIRGFFAAWLRSPGEAFSLVASSGSPRDNYYPEVFILSWMLQYGHGCEIDLERSRAVLRAAVPEGSPCWEYEQHWDALVYDDDQSCLGWAA